MLWLESLDGYDGRLPAALVLRGVAETGRRRALRALAAAALGLDRDEIDIRHEAARAPRILRPRSGLHCSSASRAGGAAVAVAERPIGIDVEVADAAEIPWNVLHPAERQALAPIAEAERARAFARLWSVKEAYLKALGVGLAREASSFAVHCRDAERATIEDPFGPPVAVASTRFIAPEMLASLVILA
jgi:4'-phosphopantetheinyl transferase